MKIKQVLGNRLQEIVSAMHRRARFNYNLQPTTSNLRGFTLIETLVAVSLLTIAIVAPMTLTQKSLSTAYYARDQITAYNLAQEGIESVRAIRDGQILLISQSADSGDIDMFGTIPLNQDFIIDGLDTSSASAMSTCSGTCPNLQLSLDGALYGYGTGWKETKFIRTMRACYIQTGGACSSTPVSDEIQLTSTVSWELDSGQIRSFTIYENVYRWINDGSAAI